MDAQLPSVPRNGSEWAQAFRQADKVEEFAITTLTGDNLRIHPGLYVSITPDGSRRYDASLHDAEQYAQVVATAVHAKYGKEEFHENIAADVLTKDLVPTIGPKELIRLTHETYQFADRISRKVPIVAFSPCQLSLPVIDDKTYYVRTTLAVKWASQPYTLTIASYMNHDVCSDQCKLDNEFDVNKEPIMRFCERCEIWFHTQCLSVSPATSPTLLDIKATRPDQPADDADADRLFASGEINFSGHDFEAWTTLLYLPIQRGHVDYPWLLSFELLLLAVRAHDRAWGCPSDVQEFVTKHLSMAPSLTHLTDKYCTIVLASKPSVFYWCPQCGGDI
ncbi:hypothetical protein PYCCODRAFT_1472432 [Trametes coccinea BRFM310]|uniref:Uncharacterized protein n=1 Tax=Trametes coccinea (strain BRFM310) TaxID=1353009 RepID=A0A1Y2I8M2_TRAC3|nr:hypothetical protein PYCCODRAFT_1472432 [Trametes coccinea BRFM310]